MKTIYKSVLVLSLVLLCGSVSAQKNKKMKFKTEMDSVSYSLGVNVGNQLKNQGVEGLNAEAFAAALQDVMADKKQISDEEANQILNAYFTKQKELAGQKTKKAGEDFLAKNAKRKEVTTLPSGLQYEVMTMGEGEKPGPTSKVTTHYHGTLIDGTVFDSSVDRGQPASFGVNQVIKGWTEALQLMPVGSKWKLFIPYDLAYGANPRPGGAIKPYDALIFEVELISID